jgi:hypothetical protein
MTLKLLFRHIAYKKKSIGEVLIQLGFLSREKCRYDKAIQLDRENNWGSWF